MRITGRLSRAGPPGPGRFVSAEEEPSSRLRPADLDYGKDGYLLENGPGNRDPDTDASAVPQCQVLLVNSVPERIMMQPACEWNSARSGGRRQSWLPARIAD